MKVTLLLLALSLTPVLVAGIVKVHRAKEQGKASEKAHYILAATSAARALDQLAERALAEAELLARNYPFAEVKLETLKAQLRKGGPAPPFLGRWEAASLVNVLNDAEQTVFVALPDGRMAFTVPYRNVARINLREEAWADGLPPEGGVVSARLEHLTSNRLSVLVAVAPVRLGGQIIAFVGVVVHAARVADLVQQVGRDIRGTVDVFDPEGGLVTTSRGALAPDAEAAAEHRRFLPPEPPPSADTLDHDDEEWVVAWAPVERVPLTVQIRVPAAQAYRHVYVLIWLLTGVIVLTFCFVTLFSDYLASVLLRPILDLERGAEMIGAGMLDYRIEVESHADDELGRLASAFNRMGERLQGSQKQVRAYSRSLETANEELDALVYGITHDLKKSLRNIEAFATFLQEDYAEALGADGLGLARSIDQAAQRLDIFTDDLIRLVQRERVRGDASRFPLRQVIEEARNRVFERRRGLVHLPEHLPELHADRLQLVMMFDNLIDNGLKFNQHTPPEVWVRCIDEGLDWRLEVQDNGIGIDERYHQQVFELFRRLNHQDDYPGAGTGLNLVRRIVEDHRGTIAITSAPGAGTTVAVTLPKEPMLLTLPGIRLGVAEG